MNKTYEWDWKEWERRLRELDDRVESIEVTWSAWTDVDDWPAESRDTTTI